MISKTRPYILTQVTRTFVNIEEPHPSQIHMEDIAWSLSQTCRWVGHTEKFYSVAEHALHVVDLLEASKSGRNERLAGLHHDSHEAFLGDISSPLGHILPGLKDLKAKMDAVIAERAGFSSHYLSEQGASVMRADMILWIEEAHKFFPAEAPMFAGHDVTKGGWTFSGWTFIPRFYDPPVARERFIARHRELGGA